MQTGEPQVECADTRAYAQCAGGQKEQKSKSTARIVWPNARKLFPKLAHASARCEIVLTQLLEHMQDELGRQQAPWLCGLCSVCVRVSEGERKGSDTRRAHTTFSPLGTQQYAIIHRSDTCRAHHNTLRASLCLAHSSMQSFTRQTPAAHTTTLLCISLRTALHSFILTVAATRWALFGVAPRL